MRTSKSYVKVLQSTPKEDPGSSASRNILAPIGDSHLATMRSDLIPQRTARRFDESLLTRYVQEQNRIAEYIFGLVARKRGNSFDVSAAAAWQRGWLAQTSDAETLSPSKDERVETVH
jgi:hypothetical protein